MRVLGGAIGLVCWFAPIPSAAETDPPCPPSASVDGDASLAGDLARLLLAAGVATEPTGDCPALDVRVEQTDSYVRISFRDRYDRTGQRDVRDLETAAAIVESWAVQEVEGGRDSTPTAAPVSATASGTGIIVAAARARRAGERTGMAVAFESAVGSDRSTWLGANVGGCARLGVLCVGGMIHAGKDIKATGDSVDQLHRTSSVQMLATVSMPLTIGGLTISPGAGIGYEIIRASAEHMTEHGIETVNTDNHAASLEAGVAVRRSLGQRFWIQLHGSIAAAPVRSSDLDTPRGFVRGGVGLGLALP